jgi:7-cyano-7-deazaguanine synthase
LVVLVSGGIDSSVLLAVLTKDGIECHPLFIDYGQTACPGEKRAATLVASTYRWNLEVVRASEIGRLSVSSISTGRVADDPFFPHRNLLLITIGSILATTRNLDGVAIGLIKTLRYPDCRPDFVTTATAALRASVGRETALVAPLIKYDKPTVVQLGRKLGVPLQSTFSCLTLPDRHCGRCESCKDRAANLRSRA